METWKVMMTRMTTRRPKLICMKSLCKNANSMTTKIQLQNGITFILIILNTGMGSKPGGKSRVRILQHCQRTKANVLAS